MSAAPGVVYYLNGQNNNLSYEKEVKDNGLVEHKHYLSAGGIVFAMQISRSGNLATGGTGGSAKPASTLQYLHHDHLGSVAVVTDETGSVAERLAYDPWGKRRFTNVENAGQADFTDSIVGLTLDRGFTMHEHLDEMGVIHMNGRIYDPLIGRFMSADPFIQAPENLQSHNRFAYVMNNPLSYTDPSGYFSLKKFLGKTIVRIIAAVADVFFGCASYCSQAVNAYYGYKSGGVAGFFASFIPGSENAWTNAAIDAAKGCAVSSANGGSCGRGATSGVAGGMGGDSAVGQMLAGCIASRINGGSCGDGAADRLSSIAAEYVSTSAVKAAAQSAQARADRENTVAAAFLLGVPLALPSIAASDILIGLGAGIAALSADKLYDALVFKSSYRERSLEESGIPKSEWDKYDVHHVVGRTADLAKPGRIALANVGIGIDDTQNLVPVLRTQHVHLHTNEYHITVSNETIQASNFGRRAVENKLFDIKFKISITGRYP